MPWNGWQEQDLRMNDVAIAGLSAVNDSPTELGQATTLTATVTAGTHVTYTWAFGDQQLDRGAVVTHTYAATGAYTAIVTASNLASVVTATTRVTISMAYTTTTRVITYIYDPLYRLTEADYSTGENFAYGYDAVGNRTAYTRTLEATSVITYHYDAANRLDLFYTDGAPTDLEWDANGNLLTQGSNEYTWDAANRMTGADVDGEVSTFAYNGLGQRTEQAVDGLTTEYVLDVADSLPEVIIATPGGASTYYVQVQGQVLAQQEAGEWAYTLPDHLGSVRQQVDAAGQVSLAQSFDPFGVALESAGTGASEFGYTGEQEDPGTDLLFLRARYYDPYLNRFISPDTIIPDFRNPQSLNRYSYVVNNPTYAA
jgi:RHS repeat-associated protein